MTEKIALLRHSLATAAYRGNKSLRGAPPEFADFKAAPDIRTPVQILAHVGDLFDWAVGLTRSEQTWHDSKPLPWKEEVARFHAGLKAFDDALTNADPDAVDAERILQAPIADTLTHIGQIALLRRMAGVPIRGESYFKANIRTGVVGPEQADSDFEFD